MSKRINVRSCDVVCRVGVATKRIARKAEDVGCDEPEILAGVSGVEGEPKMLVAMSNINKSRARLRKIKRSVFRLGTLMTVAVLAIAAVLVGMKIAGFRFFTVMSGSMEPEYPVGSLLYVKPVNYYDLKVGDVISYVADDANTVVTHRIVGIEIDDEDSSVWRFKTKGDANNMADAKPVHFRNVLGLPVMVIPLMGYFAHNIQRPPGIYIVLVVGTLLLAWTFLPGTLEGRRRTAGKSVA